MLQRLSRYFHTLKHLKPSQFYYRLWRPVRAHLLSESMYPLEFVSGSVDELATPFAFRADEPPAGVEALLERRFEFVGQSFEHPRSIEWDSGPEDDLLWLFNLHYFGWAVELAKAWRATGEPQYAQFALGAMADWSERNPFPEGPGWHPYPTSRRLRNWGVALAALKGADEWEDPLGPIVGSIAQQADYLADWPERELQANHLLANLHALAWVRLQFGDVIPGRIRSKIEPFVAEFWRELDRQVRSDGAHEENSMSYHIGALKDAFELMVLSDTVGRSVAPEAHRRVREMFGFLASIIRPDGEAPLVNDSVRGYPMRASPLLAAGAVYSEDGGLKKVATLSGDPDLQYLQWVLGADGVSSWRGLDSRAPGFCSRANRDSGYVVFRDAWDAQSDYALFDVGPVGPDHQPGHAHTDTLQVLLAIDGTSVLVDPGVFTYRQGKWRDHFRSTAAHNTVEVDGQDSSEVWSAFRVARRADARLEEWRGGGHATGSHDGYRRLSDGVEHRRSVDRLAGGGWKIRDQLISGDGEHSYRLGFQLAPETRELSAKERSVVVEVGAGLELEFQFEAPENAVLSVEQGWVSERWREKVEAPRIEVVWETSETRSEVVTTIRRVKPIG